MKSYKNISPVEQLGIQPGETGEVDIPQDQEDRMVHRGAIEVVGGAEKKPGPDDTPVLTDEQKAAAEKEAAEKQAEAEAKEKADAEAKATGRNLGGRK